MSSKKLEAAEVRYVSTLVLESVDTPRVFSTKTQDFTPKFLKPVVEVHLFLKGSK